LNSFVWTGHKEKKAGFLREVVQGIIRLVHPPKKTINGRGKSRGKKKGSKNPAGQKTGTIGKRILNPGKKHSSVKPLKRPKKGTGNEKQEEPFQHGATGRK